MDVTSLCIESIHNDVLSRQPSQEEMTARATKCSCCRRIGNRAHDRPDRPRTVKVQAMVYQECPRKLTMEVFPFRMHLMGGGVQRVMCFCPLLGSTEPVVVGFGTTEPSRNSCCGLCLRVYKL